MKTNRWTLALIAAAVLALNLVSQAQEASPTPPANFLGTVKGYLTEFNPAYNFTNTTIELAVGGEYNNGVNWANAIEAQYDLGRWDVEATFRNLGVLGDLKTIEVGGGYALAEKLDTKITLAVEGGYDFGRDTGIFEPIVRLRKKGTANTFFELKISWPIWIEGKQNTAPNIGIYTGCTF